MYTGADTVEWLFSTTLQVDDEWSERTPRGFRWWADQQAQTVEVVHEEGGPDGETGYDVAVRTEFLRDVDLGQTALTVLNDVHLTAASLAGLVYDPDARSLDLCSLVRVHEEIAQWANALLAMAAVLQLTEAQLIAPVLASMMNAEVATSHHPESGPRPQPDDMLSVVAGVVLPRGQLASLWTEPEFNALLLRHAGGPPCLLASGGGAGITVEFPWADQSSLCRMIADQPHPGYGNGLLVVQSFRVDAGSDEDGVALALELNAAELLDEPFGYGLGSYAWRNGLLHFSTFYPNALYKPEMLGNLYWGCAARARRLAVRFTGRDWDDDSITPLQSAVGRLLSGGGTGDGLL